MHPVDGSLQEKVLSERNHPGPATRRQAMSTLMDMTERQRCVMRQKIKGI